LALHCPSSNTYCLGDWFHTGCHICPSGETHAWVGFIAVAILCAWGVSVILRGSVWVFVGDLDLLDLLGLLDLDRRSVLRSLGPALCLSLDLDLLRRSAWGGVPDLPLFLLDLPGYPFLSSKAFRLWA
jgi:hypothetical protein